MQISTLKTQCNYSMPQNSIAYKQPTLKNCQTNPINLLNGNAIYNKALISFKGKNYTYDDFVKTATSCKIINLKTLKKNIKEKNLIGSGQNSRVYKFDDKKLSRWVLKVYKEPIRPLSDAGEIVDDKFSESNVGQEIARMGDRYAILLKVDGVPHSIAGWYDVKTSKRKITKEEAIAFKDSLKKISSFPQKSFDEYAKQLEYLDGKNCKQDCINPNNLLIDYSNKKINIIDMYSKPNSGYINSCYDLSSGLLDFLLFGKFYEKLDSSGKKELIDSAKTIIDKCKKAAEKTKITTKESAFYTYLEKTDTYFSLPEGTHRSRYETMKKLIYQ